ncbi:hypothetical protein JCM5296_005770 [Sporobolomyces johnsonii]
MGLWSRTYVCCAVPLYNSGIYAVLAQFLIISIVTGVLCFAAPSIIAVTTPDFVSYILGVICMVVALAQPFGFFGVYRERVGLFRTYSRINMFFVLIALALALAIIIASAVKHSTAVTACEKLFSADSSDSTANTICNIWTWVQVGIMGLLFVIVGLCELYFLMYSSIYASEQKLDHARYNSVYSTAAEEIRASGFWDGASVGRPSYSNDDLTALGYPQQQHGRNLSKSSGLRHELARGEPSQEYLAEMGAGAAGGYGEKGKGGTMSTVVSGYHDEEERYEYGGGRGAYDAVPGGAHARFDSGFRPPQHSSAMQGGGYDEGYYRG